MAEGNGETTKHTKDTKEDLLGFPFVLFVPFVVDMARESLAR